MSNGKKRSFQTFSATLFGIQQYVIFNVLKEYCISKEERQIDTMKQ